MVILLMPLGRKGQPNELLQNSVKFQFVLINCIKLGMVCTIAQLFIFTFKKTKKRSSIADADNGVLLFLFLFIRLYIRPVQSGGAA